MWPLLCPGQRQPRGKQLYRGRALSWPELVLNRAEQLGGGQDSGSSSAPYWFLPSKLRKPERTGTQEQKKGLVLLREEEGRPGWEKPWWGRVVVNFISSSPPDFGT